MSRVLFVASHRKDRAPGQRFRFEQYLPHLEASGFRCELSPLVSEHDDRFLYAPGNYLRKAWFTRKAHRIRRRDAARADEFDIVFVCREALMTRSTRWERAFARSSARMIYDFDDAVWLENVSGANRAFSWIKDPKKTSCLIGLADVVFAGNEYLAEYARRFNPDVRIVPTTIDTDLYRPVPREVRTPVCIGWSGSITTVQHFRHALPALRELKRRHGDSVSFKVIGDPSYRNEELGIEGVAWSKDSELSELGGIDVGIMPLPDDDWARGKCGLKGLQYMALGIPTVMSPVGVNGEIVTDGVDGFLPDSTEQWIESLDRLVLDPGLRTRVGARGRETVVARYSLESQRDRYVGFFEQLITL